MTIEPKAVHMIIGLETILWVWYDKDDYLMKTHMDHAEIFNISIEKEREPELHMFPPSKIELIVGNKHWWRYTSYVQLHSVLASYIQFCSVTFSSVQLHSFQLS